MFLPMSGVGRILRKRQGRIGQGEQGFEAVPRPGHTGRSGEWLLIARREEAMTGLMM